MAGPIGRQQRHARRNGGPWDGSLRRPKIECAGADCRLVSGRTHELNQDYLGRFIGVIPDADDAKLSFGPALVHPARLSMSRLRPAAHKGDVPKSPFLCAAANAIGSAITSYE